MSQLRGDLHATGKVSNIVTPPLVSTNGHAVLLPILVGSDAAIKPVVALVQKDSRTPGLPGRGHRHPHRRKRLRHALAERPEERRARLRAPGRARDPRARLRRCRRRARPGADGDRLDHRRDRPRHAALARVQPLGLHREHAHRDGARARDRLLALRHLALPRGARGRRRRGARDRARRSDGEPGGALQRQHLRGRAARAADRADERSCAASPPARSSSASSRSPPR